ncbi:MAG: hypothetical protein HWE16_09800 [Gammaproteobacteria bacterium]|nr:hypothetical protein [Gammaproteobacteria bacterium]
MIKRIVLSSICVLLASCQASKTASVQDKSTTHHGIFKANQNQIGEVCPELIAGQTFQFKFEANFPVTFNLHYHHDKETVYPISKRNLTQITDQFTAPQSNTYCLMWKTLLDQTKIKYQYQIFD